MKNSSLLTYSTSVTYTYDSDGIRGTKKVNGIKSTYHYVGGQLRYEERGNTAFYYFYDASGNLSAIRYVDASNNVYQYYALTNAQGDVIAFYNAAGNCVVTYEYDAWGNCKITKDTNGIGELNPIRYRGYYYDSETGLYYLQSRYYDPQIGRFLNADSQISGVGGDVNGYNMFSYCMNNPVNLSDSTGHWPEKWVGKLVAVTLVAVAVVAAVAITVSTCGPGSIAGVAVITSALTLAARATEVATLQVKKSKSSFNGSTNSDFNNSTNTNKQIAIDVTEALFDNGLAIVGTTPVTKASGIMANHTFAYLISKKFGDAITLSDTLYETGGKTFPYIFVALAWCETTISIFSDEPEQRAEQRGYTLK